MAAFDFPNSPSVNDQYTANGVTFKWNGTIWQRISASSGAQGTTGSSGPTGAQGAAAGLTISTSAPGSPSAGDMWWDSDSGLFLTYYNDGNSSQWVELNQGPKGAQGATGPTGATGSGGSTGAQGAAGAQGATGAAGSNATISNNGNDRIITGGSGTNLNGEANLQFDGTDLYVSDKIKHLGDPDTLIEFATDTITLDTAGAERLRIQPTGRVGIGTNNPPDCTLTVCEFNSGTNISDNIALRLQGSTGQNVALQFTDTTGAAAYIAVQGDALRLGTNNAERLRITSAGFVQVGDGTVAAEAPLHVTAENSQGINAIFGAKDFVPHNNFNYADANIALQGRDAGDSDTGAGIQFTVRNTGNSNWLHGAITMDQSSNYIFKNDGAGTTVGTEKLRITSVGSVGINSTSPDRRFTLHQDATCRMNLKSLANSTAGIEFGDEADHNAGYIVYDNTDNSMQFGVNAGERVRIDSSGRLLVGQTSGSSPLCVSVADPVIAELHHSDGGTNDQARISLGALASNPPSNRGVNLIGENNGAGHDFVVACSASHSAGPGEKVRIGSAGQIGLGGKNYGSSGQVLTSQGSGSAVQWASPSGTVLQTVGPNILASNFTTSSGTYQDSGIASSITLSSASNKVLIVCILDVMGYGDRDRRPNTGIFYGTVSNSNKLAQQVAGEYHTGDSGSYSYGGHTYWFIHSPNTTSQVTYRAGLASLDGSNVRIHGDTGVDTRSYMYLQELG